MICQYLFNILSSAITFTAHTVNLTENLFNQKTEKWRTLTFSLPLGMIWWWRLPRSLSMIRSSISPTLISESSRPGMDIKPCRHRRSLLQAANREPEGLSWAKSMTSKQRRPRPSSSRAMTMFPKIAMATHRFSLSTERTYHAYLLSIVVQT